VNSATSAGSARVHRVLGIPGADFLGQRIKTKAIKADFASALAKALTLAKTREADYLPGWCGSHNYAAQAPGKAKNQDAEA
jgi:hypothetical protein